MKLRKWQQAALPIWLRNKKGIVKVVTGGGKTVFAIRCIQEILKGKKTPNKVLILVPTVTLLDQWSVELQDQLNMNIDKLGGGFKTKFKNQICISTYGSVRNINKFYKKSEVFLICDECHKSGTEIISKALKGSWGATLGLSATPERDFDTNFEDMIVPILGNIIYEYDYSKAYIEKIISNFELLNVYAPLLEDEMQDYDEISKKIGRRIAILGGLKKSDKILKILFFNRARIVNNSINRIPTAFKALQSQKRHRWIIFSENIEQASLFSKVLEKNGFKTAEYHSSISPRSRQRNLYLLKNNLIEVLVTCKSLDEGFDYPDLDAALILSSSSTSRQRIQRLGRVLRRTDDKKKAIIVSIYSSDDEYKRLQDEEKIYRKIGVNVNWSKLKV